MQITPNCNDFLLACEFNGHKIECAKDFEVVVTDYGFCCSFNVIPYSQNVREEAMDDWHRYSNKDGTNQQSEELDDLVEAKFVEDNSQFCPVTPLDTGKYDNVCNAYIGNIDIIAIGAYF